MIRLISFFFVFSSVVLFAQDFSSPNFLSSTSFEIDGAVMADLDGDGDLDGIVGGIGVNANGIETWINNEGVFTLLTDNIPNSGFGAQVFAAADLNADSSVDLVTVIEENLVWFSNLGSGFFASPVIIESGLNSVQSIEIGNLDNSGGPDIVLAVMSNDEVRAYSNDGNANFSSPVQVSLNTTDAIDVKIVDLNNDGLNDILTACLNGCDVTWQENLGNMVFGPLNTLTTSQTGTYSVGTADFDSDGDQDIVSAGFGTDDLSYFENLGAGSFGPRTVISDEIDGATYLAVGDFNTDGNADVAVGAQNINTLSIFGGNGSGGFILISLEEYSVDNMESIMAADVNNDGRMDLMTATSDDNKFAWYPQKTGSSPGLTSPFVGQQIINKPSSAVNGLTSVDINNDGFPDLTTVDAATGFVSYFENDGAGNFDDQRILMRMNEGVSGIAAGDFNNDGFADLAISHNVDSTVTIVLNLDGGTTFDSQPLDSGLALPYTPVLVDLDNDGNLDILQSVGFDLAIYIYPSNGDGTFGARQTFCGNCTLSSAVGARDMNNDDLPEVFFYNGSFQQIQFCENLGGFNFGPKQLVIDNFNGGRDIVFFDFDEDGDEDVFAAAIFDTRINYAENQGDLSFTEEMEIPFNFSGSTALTTLDADLDGDLDLAVADLLLNVIQVILIEDGEFISRQTIDNAYENPNSLLSADFNSDGKDDLASCFRNHTAWYANETTPCNQFTPSELNTVLTPDQVVFSWSVSTTTEACRIRLQNLNTTQIINHNVIGAQEYAAPLSFFTSGHSYAWRVRCACSVDPLKVTANSSVQFFSIPSELVIFPNPATDAITVSRSDSENLNSGSHYRIFDLLGKLVMEGSYFEKIDLSNLHQGVYLIEMNGEKARFSKR